MTFNVHRKDSGWLRLFITILYSLVSVLFLWGGYSLIKLGTRGNWEIVTEFKGWELYVASLSPGIFLILVGGAIMVLGLSQTLKHLE